MGNSSPRENQSRYVLLGMLLNKPGTGYELRERIQDSVGYFWSESWGQIYPTLRRLQAQGLIEGVTRRCWNRPDAREYSITPQGMEELQGWLAQPPRDEVPRNEMLLKLFFGDIENPRWNLEMISRRRERFEHRLDVFTRLEKAISDENAGNPHLLFWVMTVRYGQRQAEAEIAWCTDCLERMHAAQDAEADRYSGFTRAE